MHQFVQRIVRGVIFCSVSIVIAACAGNDLAESELLPKQPVVKSESEEGLPRIDAIRLRVARNALQNGDFNTAIRFFESVRLSSPDHPAPILGIAKAEMAAGRHEQAILAYRDVLELDSGNDEALDGMARTLVLNGNYASAIKFFNRLLAKAPSADLHNRLGVAHDLMGDGAGAQRHYREALVLDPEAISPRNNLALSLAISEQYAEAIKHMERVASHPQATGKHRQNLAFVYGMSGENNAAAASYAESGLTPSEIAKKRAVYKRLRELAREGRHAEILEYLRTGQGIDGPMVAHSYDETDIPADRMASLSSTSKAGSSMASVAPTSKVLPSKPLKKHQITPKKFPPDSTQMTRRSSPAASSTSTRKPRKSAKTRRSRPPVDGVYRVQLAAYRTVKTAARGMKILKSMLTDVAEEYGILVKRNRSADPRAIDYRIRTTQLPNHDTAGELCTKVRTAGHPDCLVILHNPRVWAGVDHPDIPRVAGVSTMPAFTGDGAWHLQLASYRTEQSATRGQAVLKKLLGNRAVHLDILVRRNKKTGASAFNYQIRTGAIKSRAEGAELCEILAKAGHKGCLAVRHGDQVWKALAEVSGGEETSVAGKGNNSQGDGADMAALAPKAPLPQLKVLRMPAETGMTGDEETWRLQLASYRTEKSAAKGQAVLRKLLGDLKVNLDVLEKRAKSDNAAAYNYRIRTGPIASRAEGASLCATLKKAGHIGCLIIRHNKQLWKTLAMVDGQDAAAGDSPPIAAKQGAVKEEHKNTGRIKPSLGARSQTKQNPEPAPISEISPAAGPRSPESATTTSSLEAGEPSYRLQLASYKTQIGAEKGMSVLRNMLGERGTDLEIMVRRGRSSRPSAFDYIIRTRPLKSRSEGTDLCKVLKKEGHRGCFVVQHKDHLWTNLARSKEREKASLSIPQMSRPNGVVTAGLNQNQIIELPSSIIMETGHTDKAQSDGSVINPATPAVMHAMAQMADI